ncbi:MAG: VOC family protein [Dehalococcoidia bacterium]|nr:MAG: VOC family protein [Dehalococcoidia bacterium]
MPTQISTMLAVSDPPAAIDFYKRAFGAELLWQIGDPAGVAGMSIDGARFFLADENPPSTRSPERAGHTTIRIELFVDDPHAVYENAVAAGAHPRNPVTEHTHATVGSTPALRMLQGSVLDPFGHVWLIGKFLTVV